MLSPGLDVLLMVLLHNGHYLISSLLVGVNVSDQEDSPEDVVEGVSLKVEILDVLLLRHYSSYIGHVLDVDFSVVDQSEEGRGEPEFEVIRELFPVRHL